MLAGARLTVLDLSDNAVGPVGMDGLHVLLTSPVCYSLRRLLLNNNGWGPTGGVVSETAPERRPPRGLPARNWAI